MAEAIFIEDLSVGAKRFWLREPLRDYDYVIVAPEPSSRHTSVYAATDHGDIDDIKDEDGNPVVLARFPGMVNPEEALARLGYGVAMLEIPADADTPTHDDAPDIGG